MTRRGAVAAVSSAAAGRADLVRAWATGGEAGLAAMARLLGYEDRDSARPAAVSAPMAAAAGPELPVPLPSAPAEPFAPVPFWRLDAIEHLEAEPPPPPAPPAPAIGPEGVGRREGEPPATPPLVSDARLWPALRRRLASATPSREVDVPALAERWSRGRPVERIPFRPMAAWAPRVTVLVDRSARLIPFWDDQDRLLARLRRRLGRAAVQEVLHLEGFERPWRFGRSRRREPPAVPGAVVLALGDLGLFAGAAGAAAWRALAHRQRRAGARLAALVLCPAPRWDRALARLWDAADWEHPRRAPRAGPPLDDEALRRRAERLLALLSFAARLEPGLLRAVRRLLPAAAADAGTEADAWAHPEVAAGFAPSATLSADARRRLQPRFVAEDAAVKRGVVAALRAWRAGLPEEIWLDEVLGLAAAAELPPGALEREEVAAAHGLWRRIAETAEGGAATRLVTRAVQGFTRRSLQDRQPPAVWADAALRPVLWRAWQAAWPGEPPLPAGVGPEVLPPGAEVRRWQVRQVGGALRVVPAGAAPEAGSPLAELESTNATVAAFAEGARLAPPHPLDGTTAIPLPAAPSLLLRTDRAAATLRRETRPAWASAMGRDRFGLWASFAVAGIEQKMRWMPPGRFWMGSPEDEPGRWGDEGPRHLETIPRGFWLADTPCTQALWELVMGANPSRFKSPTRPVEQVSWEDCRQFLIGLNEQVEGLEARLPLENEWEYACRAGTETATWAGPMEIRGERNAPVLDAIAWYGGNSESTQPVALKQPNPWGLYDMLGNVYEWCEDLWRPSYDAESEGSSRVLRGGSWHEVARFVRSAYRYRLHPSYRWIYLGFRLARGQGALQLQPGAEPRGAERPRGVARRGTRRPRRGPRDLTPDPSPVALPRPGRGAPPPGPHAAFPPLPVGGRATGEGGQGGEVQ